MSKRYSNENRIYSYISYGNCLPEGIPKMRGIVEINFFLNFYGAREIINNPTK